MNSTTATEISSDNSDWEGDDFVMLLRDRGVSGASDEEEDVSDSACEVVMQALNKDLEHILDSDDEHVPTIESTKIVDTIRPPNHSLLLNLQTTTTTTQTGEKVNFIKGSRICTETEDPSSGNGDPSSGNGDLVHPPRATKNRRRRSKQKRAFLDPNTEMLNNKDWKIPDFPDKKISPREPSALSSVKKQPAKIPRKNSKTNTTPEDFDILYNITNDPTNSLEMLYTVLVGKLDSVSSAAATPVVGRHGPVRVGMFDKSSSTDDLPQRDSAGDCQALGALFPSVPLDDLRDIYDRCGGELNWATNILLDSNPISNYTDPIPAEALLTHEQNTDVTDLLPLKQETTPPPPQYPPGPFHKNPPGPPHKRKAYTQHFTGSDSSKFNERGVRNPSAWTSNRRDIEESLPRDMARPGEVPSLKYLAERRLDFYYKCNPSNYMITSPPRPSVVKQVKSTIPNTRSRPNTGKNGGGKSSKPGEQREVKGRQADPVEFFDESLYRSNHPAPHYSRRSRGGGQQTTPKPEPDPPKSGESSNGGRKTPEGWNTDRPSQLEMGLNVVFAYQLQELFGDLGFEITDSIDQEFLEVKVDLEMAKLLHSQWGKTLADKRAQREEDLQRMMREDELLATWLQFHDDDDDDETKSKILKKPTFLESLSYKYPTSSSLRDIISEEETVKQVTDYELRTLVESSGNDISTRLKRTQLKKVYPGVDTQLLEEIFTINGFSLSATVNAVKVFLDIDPNRAGSSTQNKTLYENDLLQIAKRESVHDLHQDRTTTTTTTTASGGKDADVEDGIYQQFDNPTYADFRARADLHADLRRKCYQKAMAAHQRGYHQLAVVYSQQGRQHTFKLDESNKQAAEATLAYTNLLRPDRRTTLDLHLLHVREAVNALHQRLAAIKHDASGGKTFWKHGSHLNVITGKGSHSHDGIARINIAIKKYLKRNNYSFTEPHEGIVRISIR